ncbi:uncharacterized protein LOC119069728 isoform X2 [Bradysia coprophila]|uniref:uncharacterized protein LOC119069728 isoform X2 n=1 Tax=Bradysia coprophila TaxID=38358 RepID=UPI00187D9336|nr:uncharacterized protein LOC119069728 isoform X2 [Bradysia coprophila]
MALQLFRIGIIGTLFIRCLFSMCLLFMKCFKNLNCVVAIIVLLLVCINMPVISPTQTTTDDPQLKIIKHPPANAIFSQLQPLFLPCSANYTGPYDDGDYDDGDVMDDLQEGEEKAHKMKKTHFTDLKPDDRNEIMIAKNVDSNDDDDEDDGDDSGTGVFFKRDTYGRENKLIYKWLRNGLPLIHRSDFDVFPNGTLKLTKSKSAAGIYQCVVADGSKLGIGAVISTACNVEKAVFARYAAEKNISAETGSFVVIECPFYSVPAANITWRYANNKTIDFNQNNRMFQLLNGSLLITQVKESDSQTYKCTAQNAFFHTRPVRSYSSSLEVVNATESQLKSGMILPLWTAENRTIVVKTGGILKLFCVASSEEVRWTFRQRNGNQSFRINDTSNVLVFRNVSYPTHDGFYNCSTTTDSLMYNVTISVPPTIVQQLNSKTPGIGEFGSFNCTATGNPKPTISWYKNGAPLLFDYIVTYNDSIVNINTYEKEHKGIYQCVAHNSAGEAHSSALYSWINKRITEGPQKVKCYPLNQSSMLIDYENTNRFQWHAIVYYTSTNRSSFIEWKSTFEHNIKRFDGKVIVPISSIDLFDPFMFYMRGMMKIGHEGPSGQKLLYDMSKLSKGTKCALQGLEIYSIVHQTGIFIWWPKLHIANLSHLNIQFRYNDTSNPTKFSDQIIGTKDKLKEMERWDDIQPKLIKIKATTNVYPEFQGTRDRRFVPNNFKQFASSSATASLPLYMNDELKKLETMKRSDKSEGITEVQVQGEVTGILIPNTSFIDVRVLVPVMDTDGELYQDNSYVQWKTISKPSTISQFQIIETESRSITLSSSDKSVACIQACVMTDFATCHLIHAQKSKFRIKNLTPNEIHRIFLYDCVQNYSQLGEFNARTKQDVPGTIKNYTIYNNNGWKLKWSPPDHTTGLQNIRYYEIEWTINDELHSRNVSYDKNYFEFPFGQDDKFNITIRAVSDAHGIPIHINSENISQDRSNLFNTKRRDPTLGILIGTMLSILCIVITLWIIVRYRTCSKHDSGHNVTRNTTSPIPTQSATCNLDLHEMQNLIAKAETLAPNGLVRHSGNGNNAVSERIMLNSSTPKKPRNDEDFSCVIKAKEDEFSSNPAQLHFPAGAETNQSNGATCVDDNNAVLPQKVHSNVKNVFPSTPPNGNLKAPSNPQYSTDSLINTSLFDRSQQQLLNTTIDSNTSNINLSTLNENDDTLELNGDSSYSQQPLHNWNFRRPIIGPNG